MLTPEQIVERAQSLDILCAEYIIDRDERVRFCVRFDVCDGEEVNDAASRTSIYLQDELRRVGLCVAEIDSDNDSVWGVIEEASGPNDSDLKE